MREFKQGDVIVHKGIQMCIDDKYDDKYRCIWFEDNDIKQDTFKRNQIISIEDYNKILLRKERDKVITEILPDKSERTIDDIMNLYNKNFRI